MDEELLLAGIGGGIGGLGGVGGGAGGGLNPYDDTSIFENKAGLSDDMRFLVSFESFRNLLNVITFVGIIFRRPCPSSATSPSWSGRRGSQCARSRRCWGQGASELGSQGRYFTTINNMFQLVQLRVFHKLVYAQPKEPQKEKEATMKAARYRKEILDILPIAVCFFYFSTFVLQQAEGLHQEEFRAAAQHAASAGE